MIVMFTPGGTDRLHSDKILSFNHDSHSDNNIVYGRLHLHRDFNPLSGSDLLKPPRPISYRSNDTYFTLTSQFPWRPLPSLLFSTSFWDVEDSIMNSPELSYNYFYIWYLSFLVRLLQSLPWLLFPLCLTSFPVGIMCQRFLNRLNKGTGSGNTFSLKFSLFDPMCHLL